MTMINHTTNQSSLIALSRVVQTNDIGLQVLSAWSGLPSTEALLDAWQQTYTLCRRWVQAGLQKWTVYMQFMPLPGVCY